MLPPVLMLPVVSSPEIVKIPNVYAGCYRCYRCCRISRGCQGEKETRGSRSFDRRVHRPSHFGAPSLSFCHAMVLSDLLPRPPNVTAGYRCYRLFRLLKSSKSPMFMRVVTDVTACYRLFQGLPGERKETRNKPAPSRHPRQIPNQAKSNRIKPNQANSR